MRVSLPKKNLTLDCLQSTIKWSDNDSSTSSSNEKRFHRK